MNKSIVAVSEPVTCEPVTCGRALGDCWIGGHSLSELQAESLNRVPDGSVPVFLRSDAWVTSELLAVLAGAGGCAVCRDEEGRALAWAGGTAGGPSEEDSAVVISAPKDCFLIRYPWDILRINEYVVGCFKENIINGEMSAGANVDGVLLLGEGSRVMPGVFMEGNVLIGRNCRIGPNCYIRGNTAIGDGCHIGQAVEVKNSLIMARTSIGHLSYCGDSIVGTGVNFGAGTITANFRHDGGNHRSMLDGKLVDTGRRKFGAIIGDGVHTGIHTSIYPGRKIWPGVATRPGDIVSKDLKTQTGAGSPGQKG